MSKPSFTPSDDIFVAELATFSRIACLPVKSYLRVTMTFAMGRIDFHRECPPAHLFKSASGNLTFPTGHFAVLPIYRRSRIGNLLRSRLVIHEHNFPDADFWRFGVKIRRPLADWDSSVLAQISKASSFRCNPSVLGLFLALSYAGSRPSWTVFGHRMSTMLPFLNTITCFSSSSPRWTVFRRLISFTSRTVLSAKWD